MNDAQELLMLLAAKAEEIRVTAFLTPPQSENSESETYERLLAWLSEINR